MKHNEWRPHVDTDSDCTMWRVLCSIFECSLRVFINQGKLLLNESKYLEVLFHPFIIMPIQCSPLYAFVLVFIKTNILSCNDLSLTMTEDNLSISFFAKTSKVFTTQMIIILDYFFNECLFHFLS